MGFFLDGAPVPVEWRTADLWLRALRPDVAELDYDALMESRQRLRLWSDWTWPSDDFTLVENRQDLVDHERDWVNREAFAYTVLTPDGSRCEGCVYIEPFVDSLGQRGCDPAASRSASGDDVAVVTFWVRESALAAELDRHLLTGLRAWFREKWPVNQFVYLINDNQHRDRELFEEAGLMHCESHPSTRSPLMWHLYTEP